MSAAFIACLKLAAIAAVLTLIMAVSAIAASAIHRRADP